MASHALRYQFLRDQKIRMKINAWIRALRLRTLPLSVSGIIIGAGLAKFQLHHMECSEERRFWPITLLALLTTISFQIVSNLANDLGDSAKGTDNKNRIGPVRAVQSGEISLSSMRIAVFVSAIIALILALILINVSSPNLSEQSKFIYAILSIVCVFAAITYTVGKNAYGYRGLGDAMVFIFFGLVSVIGCYLLYGFEYEHVILFFACAIGFWSSAVLNLNNLRDMENDRDSKKNTLVVKMGFQKGKFYHGFLVLGGILLWSTGVIYHLVFMSWDTLVIISLCPCLLFLYHLYKLMNIAEPKAIDPELKKVVLSVFLCSVLLSVFLNWHT